MLSILSYIKDFIIGLLNPDHILLLVPFFILSLILYVSVRYLFPNSHTNDRNKGSTLAFSPLDVGDRAAVVSIKGHRQHMEDTYQAIPKLGHREHWSFYGVFDGHGGARCSAFAAQFLYRYIWSSLADYIHYYSIHNFVKTNNSNATAAVQPTDLESDENSPNKYDSDGSSASHNANESNTKMGNCVSPSPATFISRMQNSGMGGDTPMHNSNVSALNDNLSSPSTTPMPRYKDIPPYIQQIMRDALVQAHRDADEEFLQIANRQQWHDGSTSVSALILPGRDLVSLLSNPTNNLNPTKNRRRRLRNGLSRLPPASKHSIITQTTRGASQNSRQRTTEAILNDANAAVPRILNVNEVCDDGDTWLFVANCGDSRAIVVTADGSAIPMSHDHKPNRYDERSRIENEGGRVVFFGTWRVEGVLAVARALGDRHLKRWVIPDPDIVCRKIQTTDLFLIEASDGVWDVISNADAARLAVETWNNPQYRSFSIKERLQFVASKLTSIAYRTGSMDNITTLVAHLNSHCTSNGQTFNGDPLHRTQSTTAPPSNPSHSHQTSGADDAHSAESGSDISKDKSSSSSSVSPTKGNNSAPIKQDSTLESSSDVSNSEKQSYLINSKT